MDGHRDRRVLARRMRLSRASDFTRVFNQPTRSSNPAFTVLARPNGLPFPRLGLAIARKHVRRAVDRNRLKRIIRESFRHNLSAVRGIDVVVLSRAGCGDLADAQARAALEQHWKRLSAKCPSTTHR